MEDYYCENLIPVEVEVRLRGTGVKFVVDGYETIGGYDDLVRWHFMIIQWETWDDELRTLVDHSVKEYTCIGNKELITAVSEIVAKIKEV